MSSSHREFTPEQARRYNAETRDAIAKLEALGIPRGEDFFVLDRSKVGMLLEVADLMQYRRPKNANGSRGRYFHEMLQRRARRGLLPEFAEKVGCSQSVRYHSSRRRKKQ